mmetsp:Transcript_32885/g.82595  ORF Transcript_32885/g.82595 Transcript_32885/m.82595 type:complete len:261 (-) Transcript_32885:188-970(-)|eukprot:CAMPEP_0177664496 /NCGR_PEP_ID=MMETSP0447-20121125/20525_1 /TAXON_ID=0 /ORGANISM="Stygamoeba regulata, Strain BSH-02190019" /LENGTH=260 /DNA_ID=CAMNT_0019170473 /DNA_START=110 /DNA_END=892 /DNA_ORIENTATION=+
MSSKKKEDPPFYTAAGALMMSWECDLTQEKVDALSDVLEQFSDLNDVMHGYQFASYAPANATIEEKLKAKLPKAKPISARMKDPVHVFQSYVSFEHAFRCLDSYKGTQITFIMDFLMPEQPRAEIFPGPMASLEMTPEAGKFCINFTVDTYWPFTEEAPVEELKKVTQAMTDVAGAPTDCESTLPHLNELIVSTFAEGFGTSVTQPSEASPAEIKKAFTPEITHALKYLPTTQKKTVKEEVSTYCSSEVQNFSGLVENIQ